MRPRSPPSTAVHPALRCPGATPRRDAMATSLPDRPITRRAGNAAVEGRDLGLIGQPAVLVIQLGTELRTDQAAKGGIGHRRRCIFLRQADGRLSAAIGSGDRIGAEAEPAVRRRHIATTQRQRDGGNTEGVELDHGPQTPNANRNTENVKDVTNGIIRATTGRKKAGTQTPGSTSSARSPPIGALPSVRLPP